MIKISHKNKFPNDGHNWKAIAVFCDYAGVGVEEQRPMLWVKCQECGDTRVLIGTYFIDG